VALEAGRLNRINELLQAGDTFAFETTLSTRSYVSLIKKAKRLGYSVSLLFFWLDSPATAKERVEYRVSHGGHNIPEDVIERRYKRGLQNLTRLYIPVVDDWFIFNNTKGPSLIAEGGRTIDFYVKNSDLWAKISNE
jgi:predicted ABC-type ATPase